MGEALVEVALPVAVDATFTYRLPAALDEADAVVGRRVLVPFGKRDAVRGFIVGRPESSDRKDLKEVAALLDDGPLLNPDVYELCGFISRYYGCSLGEALDAALPAGVKKGKRRRKLPHLVLVVSPEEAKAAAEKLPESRYRQAKLLVILAGEPGPVPLSVVLRKAQVATMSPARSLVKAGLVRIEAIALPEDPLNAPAEVFPFDLALTGEQEAALREIAAAVAKEAFATFLLYGVTGSGKTEVYLRAIRDCVEKGRQAIVLVPEISLTPQTARRFRERFARVAVLHSGQTEAERSRHWRAVRKGEVDVVVGPRSAVFAPLPRLGLVVVDEEHDTSFKQANAPRYNGRDVAVVRAKNSGAVAILGSATPSLESFQNARAGRYRLLALTARVGGGTLPPVELVDMARECQEQKHVPWLSRRLKRVLTDALARGEQAMLFLNRRGYTRAVFCRTCGTALECRACTVALTWHQGRGRAVCHLCGFERRVPDLCPACQQPSLLHRGFGTEKIEEAVAKVFPEARVARMDSDTMTTRGSHERLLDRVARHEVDVLVGTQMIAKGLHFPLITVVGVLDADTSLALPDFRASERTFQMVAQVAGRAGRSERGGSVIVQTFRPDQPALTAAAAHDYPRFAEEELRAREPLLYPPFGRLLLVVLAGRNADVLDQRAGALKDEIVALYRPGEATVLGPAVPPVERVKGKYRRQIVVKAKGTAEIARAVARLRGAARRLRVEVTIDVDPVGLA